MFPDYFSASEEIKDDTYLALLDDEADIAATRPFYKRRSLAAVQPFSTIFTDAREADGAAVITVVGDLDLATVLPFRDAAFTVIGARPPRLVLNLTRLERLDITGLETLLCIARVGTLVQVPVFVIPGERSGELLTVTGLVRQLPFEENPNA